MTRLVVRLALVLTAFLTSHVIAHAVAIVVRTNPEGATVTIEGKSLPAPATFDLKRREEPYYVTVAKEGFETEAVTYSTKQKNKDVLVTLQPLRIQQPVAITSSPSGATVSIGGKPVGTTPFNQAVTFTRPDKGAAWIPVTVTVSLANHQSESFRLTQDKPSPPPVELSPLQIERSVTITSNVPDATVTLGSKAIGTTPLTQTITFTRPEKDMSWQAYNVTVAKADYQTETFRLTYDKPTPPPVVLAPLRIERTFNVSARTADNLPIEAVLAVDEKEAGVAPQKVTLVFSRADKAKAWPTYSLRGEIPGIYQPGTVTLTHDGPDNVALSLKPVTELPVALYSPVIEMTATGARLAVDQSSRIATLDTTERGADITGLARLTRFARRDQAQPGKVPLQAVNSYAITPDGQSAILALTMQDDNGKFYSGLFLKRVEDDGGGIGRLIDNNKRYFDTAPVIAPDSSNILVFQSNRGDLNKPDVFRISFSDNRTSGGVARITNDQRFNFSPTYTDSNREVVYLSIEPNYPLAEAQLSTVKMDGALPTQFQITAQEISHREPTKIYLTRPDQSNGKRQIYSVEPDGRLETTLISDESFLNANCFNPVASFTNPVRILFVSDRDADDQGRHNNNIYVMNADGSQITQLTANGSDDIMPAWSPTDPSIVYFLSNRGGAYNLWRLRIK
jgi:hypothetical protein